MDRNVLYYENRIKRLERDSVTNRMLINKCLRALRRLSKKEGAADGTFD